MAKKKINNVVINDQELMPTTLGVYSNKAKSPIIVFLILAIFLAIAFFMPDIQKSINKFLGKDDNAANNGGGGNKPITPDNPDNPNNPDNPTNEDIKYDISENTVIELDNFKIDNIRFSNGTLSIVVTSKSTVNLNPYFIELYNANNTLLGRAKLSDDTLEADKTVPYSYVIPTESIKLSVVKKSIDDYPEVNLSYNERNEATMTCISPYNEEYIYTFVSDQLSKIVYSYKLSSTDENYESGYNNYLELDNKYKAMDNVSSSLIRSDNGFDYTLNLNLDNISSDTIKEITFDGIFKIKSQAKEVKFISEAKNYKCNI